MIKFKRNGEIELLRFICALIVMFRHCKWIISGMGSSVCFLRGALAVEFFFITSGYLMAVSAKKSLTVNRSLSVGKDTTLFIKKKYLGLMPEFLFAWIISFAVAQAAGNFTLGEIFENLCSWIFELVPLSMAGFTNGSFHMAAWYISAMLLAMLILYPICRKHFDTYTRIIAPLLSIFIIGLFAMNFGSTLGPTDEIATYTYKGFPRAIAEISLGAALYPVIEHLKQKSLTRAKRAAISAVTLVCALGAGYWMTFGRDKKFDILCVAVIAVVVCLAFSHRGLFADKFDKPFFYWLGKISMLLYLCHGEWAKAVTNVYKNYISQSIIADSVTNRALCLAVFFLLSFLTAFIVYQLSNLIRKHRRKRAALQSE